MLLVSLRTIFERAAEGDTVSLVLVGLLAVVFCFVLFVISRFLNSKQFTNLVIGCVAGFFVIVIITLFTYDDLWRDAYHRITNWLENLNED